MIYLVSSHIGNRLQYIAEVLFGLILETEYKIVSEGPANIEANDVCIFYGNASLPGISIAREGLLSEDDIKLYAPSVAYEGTIPAIRFSENRFDEYSISFDIFCAAFYIITEYELYSANRFDEHGRYIEKESFVYQHELYKQPLLHVYAEYLWQKLIAVNPNITRGKRQYDYQVTFDIDSPYLYKYKPLAIQFGGLVKDLLSGRFSLVKRRIMAYTSNADPYDVYSMTQSLAPKENLHFFFLIDRQSAYDERHTYRNKAYRKLINRIVKQGIAVGIHPSYTAFKDVNRIKFETNQLQQIIGEPVRSSRMHFLKYHLPNTFRYLMEAGIIDDYTLCPAQYVGFKTGICIPYPFYDLEKNESTSLIMHPVMVMDRALHKYLGLGKEQALEEIKRLSDICRQFGGQFIILLHNNTLSENAEWKGWRQTFLEAIQYIQ